jgi:hypothetical protein
MNFLASPDIVTAMVRFSPFFLPSSLAYFSLSSQAFSGKLSFDPRHDTLLDSEGNPFKFDPPEGVKLPEKGFTNGSFSSSLSRPFSLRSPPLPYRQHQLPPSRDPHTRPYRRTRHLPYLDPSRTPRSLRPSLHS